MCLFCYLIICLTFKKGGSLMLHDLISNFLEYCKTSNFSERSIETFTIRLNEFKSFLQLISIESIGDINYEHLLQFVTDYGHRPGHVKKARVWTLHQFYHFLKLNKILKKAKINVPFNVTCHSCTP